MYGVYIFGGILSEVNRQVGVNWKDDFINSFSKLGLLYFLILTGCKNPFAPALDDRPNNDGSTISDLKNIDGVFQNFQYAYVFKDTTIYGKLIAGDFLFTYRDYDQGIDEKRSN